MKEDAIKGKVKFRICSVLRILVAHCTNMFSVFQVVT